MIMMMAPMPMIHLPVSLFMPIKNQEPISKKGNKSKTKKISEGLFYFLFCEFIWSLVLKIWNS